MGVLPQDTNFTPDFPRTAQLLQAMWQRDTATRSTACCPTDPWRCPTCCAAPARSTLPAGGSSPPTTR